MAELVQRSKFTDSGFAWIVTVASFLALYALAANIFSLGVLLPDLLEHFQVPQGMLGMLGSAKMLICDVTCGTLIGPLVRKVGCRPLAMVGLALSAVGYPSAAFANNYYSFLIMFSILPGLGQAGIVIPCNVIVHQYHRKRRALASGLSTVGMSLASFSFPVIMRLTIQSFGWRASLVLTAAIHVQMVAAAMMFMPNPDLRVKLTPRHPDKTGTMDDALETDKKEVNAQEADESNEPSKKCNVDFSIFRNPAFLLYLFGTPLALCGASVFIGFALQRAVYQGIEPVHASFVLSSFGIGALALTFKQLDASLQLESPAEYLRWLAAPLSCIRYLQAVLDS
ncbi:hypothetical protein CAPTEDRAFT_198032 [Capitella teleta]|uniref:Major facilitator superfamily (MFS) profile domain-containing protein n=1 Tax=Capitella teleta TaxID=283909 RepID=R7UGQ7_CAPTE|nr:hypothetical protein CAPTEDRAFT_198032 [Capitella teleta]|eukprot:ELU02437.1 hypothetical protein CAPTEDRAFT_198032 [Capitella teleta]